LLFVNITGNWKNRLVHTRQIIIAYRFFGFHYLMLHFFLPVGYILGLGDRHVQNILIDCNTAELVHIDLG
jgi:hypothetical protein